MAQAHGEGRVVLLTGATAGIGEASVRLLLATGHRVAATGRRAERLAALARELDPEGQRLLTLEGDVTDPAARARWLAAVQARFGRLDCLVNNAGYGQRGAVEALPLDAIRRNFETNVFALLGLTQEALPLLRAARQSSGGDPRCGRIVNISSVAGKIARPLSSTYDATKHALEAFSDGLRAELHAEGIAVVVVRPGFIDTEFAATARSTSAEAVAALEAGRYAALWRRVCAAEQKARGLAAPPEAVARVVVRAVTRRSPAWHSPVPGHARLFLWARRWLPARLFAAFLPR